MRIPVHSITTMLSTLSFYVSYAISAVLYPGGTWEDASTVGHAFWKNYLCDILEETAHNGVPNPGRGYGLAAFALLFVTLLFWWALLLNLLPDHLSRPKKIARITSWISATAFLGTLIFPASAHLISYHFFCVLLGAFFGLVATILLLVYFLRVPAHRSFGKVGLLLLSPGMVTLVIFTAYHLGLPGLSESLIIVLQKVVMISTSALCLFSALRPIHQLVKARKA